MLLFEDERLDDLQVGNLKIIQNVNKFCFGTDAVELADFVTGGANDRACDLGSGSGIISILLAGKKKIRCTAVELQKDMAEMSARSVNLNGLQEMIEVINCPMQEIDRLLGRASHTIVVSNPPYRKINSGQVSFGDSIALSRHEIAVKLKDVVECAEYLLGTGGKFYLIHHIERLAEVLHECCKNKLEPKILQILTPDEKKEPHIFMLKCIKDGKSGLKVNKMRAVKSFN